MRLIFTSRKGQIYAHHHQELQLSLVPLNDLHKNLLSLTFPEGLLLVFATANFERAAALMYSTLDDALKIVQVVVVMIMCSAAATTVVVTAVV